MMGSTKSQSNNLFDSELPWARHKRRALTIAVASALSVSPAFAQDDSNDEDDEPIEEIITTAIRSNMMSAQALKRDAETIVDSITAEELGSFPDKSIAEALQRVAGITVNRFAASSDTAHFSAEPSGVIVRGLNQVRTEFNGRDSFSANSSRGLSWGDVSPELMAGVDTYKNQMAELIEGGIAGTVNMRTRLPFDSSDQTLALSVNANYGDISEEITPEISGLYSDRWVLSGGSEFGVMANFAHSEVTTRTEGVQLYRMNRFRDVYGPDTLYYIPALVNFRDNVYERTRDGMSLALQWASADDRIEFTTQYNRSEYDNAWEEYLVQTSPADLSFSQSVFYEIPPPSGDVREWTIPIPSPGTDPFTFDSNGLFQTGVLTTGVGWWGNNNAEAAAVAANAAGQNMVNACYGWNNCDPQLRGIDTSTTTRSNNNKNMTQDLSFNIKYAISDRVRSSFDVQYIDSEIENYDIEVAMWTFATAAVDLSGAHPTVELQSPINVNQSPGGFENPNNYYIRSIMDHVEDSEGDQLALRADFEFDLESDWLESVKVGTRYADREQDVRWTTYNWQNVANTWSGNQASYWNIDRHDPDPSIGFTGYPQGHYQNRTFDPGFYGGGLLSPNTFVFANMGLLQNQQLMASSMGAPTLGVGGWFPICSNLGGRGGEVPGTCFTPAESADVSEETVALYFQLNFGGPDAELFGVPVSGNVGVRYVETTNESTGGVVFPILDQDYFFERVPDASQPSGYRDDPLPRAYENLGCYPNQPLPGQPPPSVPNTIGCYISEADYNYMDGANTLNVAKAEHEHWLPSLNIKFDLNDDWVMRFAASRAMARPDIGNMKNFVNISGTLPDQSDSSDPLWIKNSSGTITGADVRYSGSAQNPYLKPVVATQFDVTLEYYFGDPGSLTFALFQKSFDDYIQFGTYNRQESNGGETMVNEMRGPLNGEGAKISGYEVAFQRFFDFLPAPFDGIGMQANYTHINNQGITNSNVTNVGGDGTTLTGQAPDAVSVNKLEGLSDDSYTIIAMYEKGDWSARMAYSWRSEYLVTAIDCCVAYPIWNEDFGQVDGSLTWTMNDNFEFSLQVSNLMNEETVLRQQVENAEDGGLLLPNAWFQNDRRFTLGFRYRR